MFLVVRSFALTNPGTRSHFGFNYDKNGRDWNVKGGKRQSPISLWSCNSITCNVPKLKLVNYNKILSDELSVINNGLTVLMRIPKTVEGKQPSLCISSQIGQVFEAQQLHFHWGSERNTGSEHNLDGCFYDGEMHIVHKNCNYKTNQEAALHCNGFAVLALLISHLENPELQTPAMNEICKRVSKISKMDDDYPLEEDMALEDVFVGIDTHKYFAYQGSLTTPPCAEAAIWFVFQTPIKVPKEHWKNFWRLRDSRGQRVLNTYRDLQDDHHRLVYRSRGKICICCLMQKLTQSA
ncbi:carbonic anhydrase 6 isoform X1 [Drosophila subpulchrella]|uniref:carbonic anhydrase 6 isoform X1 n=1 Tax=Drosophila subpulchrella TaxID=1486046 RepID=UPI0018A1A4B8|nr:carbonic anhydrase 6 isoform X1 [Drosophila subpulchrella]